MSMARLPAHPGSTLPLINMWEVFRVSHPPSCRRGKDWEGKAKQGKARERWDVLRGRVDGQKEISCEKCSCSLQNPMWSLCGIPAAGPENVFPGIVLGAWAA